MAATRSCDTIRGTAPRINKASNRIAKKAMNVANRPAPKVYNTDPSGFRKLVQELTGLGIEPETLQPVQSEKPAFNGRLQKIAPPPLNSNAVHPCNSEIYSAGLHPNFTQKLSPLPLVSPGLFSPIKGLASAEWMMWSDDPAASPASLAYRELAQTLVDRAETLEAKREDVQDSNLRSPTQLHTELISKDNTAIFRSSESSFGPLFPRSPTSFSPSNLPSPGGFAGFEFGSVWGWD